MKKIITALAIMASTFTFSQVGIGTNTPSAKSILDLTATDKGFLLPRMTTAQRTAIAPNNTTDVGMQVYDTTTLSIWYWNGAIWIDTNANDKTNDAFVNNASNARVELNTNADGTTTRTNGTEFVIKDDGRVGVSVSDPDISARLDVSGIGGVKFPTLTYAEVLTIPSPANGLRVFCTTYNSFLTNLGTPSAPKWFAEITAEINPNDNSVPVGTIRTIIGNRTNVNIVQMDNFEFSNVVVSGNHIPYIRSLTGSNRLIRVWASSEWSTNAGNEHSVGTYAVGNGGQWTRNNTSITVLSTGNGTSLHNGISAAAANMLANETNAFIILDESAEKFYKVNYYNYNLSGIDKVVITVQKII